MKDHQWRCSCSWWDLLVPTDVKLDSATDLCETFTFESSYGFIRSKIVLIEFIDRKIYLETTLTVSNSSKACCLAIEVGKGTVRLWTGIDRYKHNLKQLYQRLKCLLETYLFLSTPMYIRCCTNDQTFQKDILFGRWIRIDGVPI